MNERVWCACGVVACLSSAVSRLEHTGPDRGVCAACVIVSNLSCALSNLSAQFCEEGSAFPSAMHPSRKAISSFVCVSDFQLLL